jgi:aspartyl-tRNA(Asn)/glutamyl-tRNA(Gln) amidotransferase subunit B
LIEQKKITDPVGRELLNKLIIEDFSPNAYVKEQGIEAIHDEDEILKYCVQAIEESPEAIADYKNGKEKAMQAIVGKVMKMSKGKANPSIVSEKIREMINK